MKINHLLTGAFALAITTAHAGEAGTPAGKQPVIEAVAEESIFDTIWGLPKLYEDESNPIIQEFNLIGRYQGQYYDVDADEQGSADGWDTRRWRLGFETSLFNTFEFKTTFNLDHEGDRFFKSLEDVALSFEPLENYEVTLGKIKPQISGEYNTSSKRIKTIERSLLVNQVAADKIWGGNVSTEVNGFGVDLGAYSGDLDGDWDFSDFDAGYLLNAAVSYEDVKLSYLYNDGDQGNNGAADYENIVSLSYANYGKGHYDGLGIFAEALYAEGDSDEAYGITIMPSYMLTQNLEAVLRYHYAGSDGDSGITAQRRYDRAADNISTTTGDAYHGVYGGVNYYIYGDKLKVMGGVEYGSLDQDNGDSLDVLTFMGGVRLYF